MYACIKEYMCIFLFDVSKYDFMCVCILFNLCIYEYMCVKVGMYVCEYRFHWSF